MSLGRDCQSSGVTQSEQDAINAAWSAGVLVVASAGNSGNSNLQCPAAADHVMAVSATTNSDTLASFSSYGSFVDLAAPGVSIVQCGRDIECRRQLLRFLVRDLIFSAHSQRRRGACLVGRSDTYERGSGSDIEGYG